MSATQWLDEKYILLLGSQLDRFHKSSRTTFTFRCPFCGDSQKKASKTRGYFFLYQRRYLYKCHNCNVSLSLRSFLKKEAPALHREYLLDVLRERSTVVSESPTPAAEGATMFGFGKKSQITIPSIASLPADHMAVQYCRDRMLPESSFSELYFSDHWTDWINELEWSYSLPEDHGPRLIIPWFDRDRVLLGAQGRRIDATGNASRYITIKAPTTTEKIYGLDRINYYQPIYVVEGPLDSWFLPNAVASMDSDLYRLHERFFMRHPSTVYIWDNEPRNSMIVKNLGEAVKFGLPVVIWPQSLQQKDLNDMAKAGHNVPELVKKNTFKGLRAELEFLRWKKTI